MVWSLCNEIECQEASPAQGQEFRAVTLATDPTRAVSGNLLHDSAGTMVEHFDVLGISHASTAPSPLTPLPAEWYDPRYSYEWLHKHHPELPLVSSESTSCNTQRGVNVVDEASGGWDDVFNADCLAKTYCPPNTSKAEDEQLPGGSDHAPGKCTQSWTLAYHPNGTIMDFMAGNLGVWTLFDYIGEPNSVNRKNACRGGQNEDCTPNWPQVSCNFGSFDLAGFPKPAAWYYRAWWLAAIPTSDPSRPPVGHANVVKIVHDWREPAPPIVAVYSNLPTVELLVDGRSLGLQQMGWANWTQWSPEWAAGNLTAVGYDAAGAAVATDSSITPGVPTSLVLSLDAPAGWSGTGSALVLDGQDAALVRASVVDAAGRLVTTARCNITFVVVGGPGRVIGVGNGDPVSHESNKVSWRTTHYGLARAVVQTSVNAATPDRTLQSEIDLDRTRTPVQLAAPPPGADEIVVEAQCGCALAAARLSIPVTVDVATHGVLAVAAANVVRPVQLG